MTHKPTSFYSALLLLVAFPITLFSQSTKGTDQNQYFPWDSRKCPDYKILAAGSWGPKSLLALNDRLKDCSSQNTTFKIDKDRTVEMIHYSYKFKHPINETSENEPRDITSDEHYYLVLKPLNRLIWHDSKTNNNDSGSFQYIHAHQVHDTLIFEIQYFTGGTGGFWEEYYIVKSEQLVRIEESFRHAAEPLVPKGFSMRRVRVDINNLTATIYVATDQEGNCCPSGRLELKLALQNEKLSLVKGHFYKN